jgi:predicted  nucleic acid-binding Zn-ribbon protein
MANQTVKVVFDGKDNTGKAIKSLRGNLDNANKAIGKIKSSLGGMTGALGAAAGAAGFGLLARNAVKTADALAKTSSKLGVTSSELYDFQTQANLAGISTDTANMALQRFVRRTAEAAQGSGEAKGALIELGVRADELQKLPLAERMKVLADAFQGVQNPADRLRLAFKLFDSEGASMVNMLGDGSESLEETEKRMRDLGIGVKSTSLPQLEAFNDAVTLMGKVVESAMIEGLGEAAPQMERVAEKLAEMAVPLTGALLDGFEFLLDNLGLITKLFAGFIAVMAVTRVVQFATALIQLGKALATIRVAAIATQAALGPIGLAMAAISTAAVFFADDVVAANDSLDDLVGGSDNATDSTDELEAALKELDRTTQNVEKPLSDHADVVDDVAEESKKAALETDEFREALEKLKDKAQAPTKAIDDFQKKVAILTEQFNKGEIGGDDFNRMLAEMTKELTGVEDELQDNIDKQKALEAAIDAAIKTGGENESQLAAMRRELEKLKDEQADLILETEGLTKAQIDLLDEIKGTTDAVADYQDAVKNLDQLLANGKITQDEYNDSLADFNEEMTGIVDPIRQADREIEALEAQIEALGENTDGTSATLQTLKARLEAAKQAASDLAGPQGQQMIRDYYDEIAKGTDPDEALDKLEAKLKEAETAAGQLFGVPMLNKIRGFFDAIGAGAAGEGAIGLLNGALTDLEGAFADFFSSGELKFGTFVENIIDGLKRIAAEAIVSVGLNFVKNIIPGLNTGGQVEGFAVGGRVTGPGGPTEDRVPAMLSPGEFVIRANSVSKFGAGFFEALNAGVIPKDMIPGFNLGGLIRKFLSGPFAWVTGGGYTIDNAEWGTYLMDLYEALSQVDPRDDPLEAYDKAMEYVVNLIGRAISDAMAKIEEVFGGSVFGDGMLGEYMGGILGPIGAMGTQDFLNNFRYFNTDEFTGGLRDTIFDKIFGPINEMKLSLPDFNMDEEFARMYMGASNVVNREFGGPLERGQASIVGENGPELFVPGRGGTVSPIGDKGGKDLINAVHEVRDEIADLRRQFTRIESGRALAGGRN